MENKRLLIMAVLLVFSITMIFAYSKITLKRKSKKTAINKQSLSSNTQQKLLKNHSHIMRTIYNLGVMELEEKNFDVAIPLIQEALILFKSQPESHYYFDTAIRSFDQIKSLLAVCDYKGAKELFNEMAAWSRNIEITDQI